MSEKRKNDLEKESNYLVIIVVLSICLICSLGYIAYLNISDNNGSTIGKEPVQNETEEANTSTKTYDKDSEFIKGLMKKIVYHSGISHAEYVLYTKDKVTLSDLGDSYKNTLVINNIGNSSFTTEELKNSSQKVFGQNIYSTFPSVIEKICMRYNLNGDTYTQDPNSPGCGGAGYQYLDRIDRVESDAKHIYVYERVGFTCPEGICTGIHQSGNDYTYDNVVKVIDNNNDYLNAEKYLDEINGKLDLYKFTFTSDSDNNYYFESVEKEK